MIILGNLDYETQLARGAGIHIELPRRVRAMLASLSTLMAALGDRGDQLWTLAPVEPARMSTEWLPHVELVAGPAPTAFDIAWGQLDAARFNHRRFDYELGKQLGSNHPGTAMVTSMAELQACIAACGDTGAWVAKAPLSASGRFRLRRRGALDKPSRTRAVRLLGQFGELLFEPWVQRSADFGCCGRVDDAGVTVEMAHVLLVDDAGVFRGIDLAGVPADAATAMTATAARVGAELSAAGYRGPFAIDGYRYVDYAGRTALRPFCELNARHSFGHIARALARRNGVDGLRLRIDRGDIPAGANGLLAAAADEPTCAWWQPPTAVSRSG